MAQRAKKQKPVEDWTGQIVMPHLPPRARVESESSLQKRVMVALAVRGALVWRNNVGAVKKGSRWIKYGLEKGSSDLVCMAPNGRVFFVEMKREKFGLISEHQKRFIDKVRRWNGLIAVVSSVEQAIELYEQACLPMVGS